MAASLMGKTSRGRAAIICSVKGCFKKAVS